MAERMRYAANKKKRRRLLLTELDFSESELSERSNRNHSSGSQSSNDSEQSTSDSESDTSDKSLESECHTEVENLTEGSPDRLTDSPDFRGPLTQEQIRDVNPNEELTGTLVHSPQQIAAGFEDTQDASDEYREDPSDSRAASFVEALSEDDVSDEELIEDFAAPAVDEDSETNSGSSLDESLEEGDEEENEEQNQQGNGQLFFDPPLYAGATISIAQSLMLILTFSIVHKLTGVALVDLLNVIALHCLARENRCIKTLYKYRKYFENMEAPLTFHYYCSMCFSVLQSKNDRCNNASCANSEAAYFLEISIVKQLEKMFQRSDFRENLTFRFNRKKKCEGNFEDIYDGLHYKQKVAEGFLSDPHALSFQWNSDGVKIHKSSKASSLWPFYLVINELPYSMRYKTENMIIAGLWFGTKPKLPMFLNTFHDDLSKLHEGVNITIPGNNIIKVRCCVLCGTLDLPAKAHFLNIKQYNGFYGCPKCMVRGERSERTKDQHVYPYENAAKRTKVTAERYATLAEHHNSEVFGYKGVSVLRLFLTDYITTTAIDVMHCVYEGVVKRLIELWFDPKYSRCVFSLSRVGKAVSDLLILIAPPSYIKRMPRSIVEHLSFWKASEFKNWLFYYSVPILKQFMSPEYFNHYLLLVHGIYLLNQDSVSEQMLNEAQLCLNEFIIKFQDLYGLEYLSLNFHMLPHLPDEVRLFGPLWTMSCMPLEDLNGRLKNLVHGTTYVSLQIASSLSQIINLPIMLCKLPSNHEIRKVCENMLNKSRLKINEIIDINISSIGKYHKPRDLPPIVHDALMDSGVEGNVTLFFRLKRGRFVFSSKSYERTTKTNSVAIRYNDKNGSVGFGLVHSFARVSNCECIEVCHCAAEFFCILSTLKINFPFKIAYPLCSVTHVMQCISDKYTAIPIQSIQALCVNVEINNMSFILNPVNTIEIE